MADLGHFRTSCHAFHESVMRFKADIGQTLLTNSDRSHDLPRLLVLPLPLIRDRPQKAALCPGQVRYFHDHFRPHPVHF
jgi:hypothetical protein